ncbi:MAG: FkbM family methyltransferase [Prolixibacteraceae bacterium]|nr:FkbM family methyltransferase [Prolixibacteraceae bacterium]
MLIKLDKIIKDFNLNIRGVLHIGAHYGEEYQDYKKQGIENMMFFEPIVASCDELHRRIATDDNIRIFNIALGNMTGEKEMYVETANNGQSCSLLEPGTHLYQYPGVIFDKKEIVKVQKLDNIFIRHDLYNMINIDVQGYELEVFKGAVETLPFIDIIYTEVNFEEVYKGCCLVGDLDNFLKEFGFQRVLTDSTPKTWGDALYLKP